MKKIQNKTLRGQSVSVLTVTSAARNFRYMPLGAAMLAALFSSLESALAEGGRMALDTPLGRRVVFVNEQAGERGLVRVFGVCFYSRYCV